MRNRKHRVCNRGANGHGTRISRRLFTALAAALAVAGCTHPSGGTEKDTVTSVTVSPKTADVPKGGTRQFSAVVTGTGSGDHSGVIWIIQGDKAAGTSISGEGLLSVAADENAATLTVRAASTVDPDKYDEATVTVKASVAITGFTVEDLIAGTPENAADAYPNAEAVIAWLNEHYGMVTATVEGGGTVDVPVTEWADTDEYDASEEGTYTFTGTLGTLPTGYTYSGTTVTIEVIVSGKPVLAGTVSISGTAKVGETLTAETGSLTYDTNGQLFYQWTADGSDVGENDASYTVALADFGKTITVTVSASKNTGSIASLATSAVAAATVSALDMSGLVSAPVKHQTPQASFPAQAQYTGAIVWKTAADADVAGTFGHDTVYKAIITLTATTGYTFAGVAANRFTYGEYGHEASGEGQITNAADSGEVTIVFPATGALTNAATPQITGQPVSAVYIIGEDTTAAALSVAATVSDGGSLSYQWYSNTSESSTGGSIIDSETAETYTPPISAEGTVYYYVVVSNTNSSVDGEKTVTAASNVATITVAQRTAAPTTGKPAAPFRFWESESDTSAANQKALLPLSSSHGEGDEWKVCANSGDTTPSEAVSASYSNGTLTLSGTIGTGSTWYVSVTSSGKVESQKLAVTVTYGVPENYRALVDVPALSSYTDGSATTGAFRKDKTVSISAFKMAKYETTWDLFDQVQQWAKANGYTFASDSAESYFQGHEAVSKSGASGGTGTSKTDWDEAEREARPVSKLTWEDAVVWCNAYSEATGLAPVYLQSGGVNAITSHSQAVSGMVMNRDKNGYRLPTDAEWELAARGGDPTGHATEWAYDYAGQNASAYNSTVSILTNTGAVDVSAGLGGKTTLTNGQNNDTKGPYQTAWWRANAQYINAGSEDKTQLDYGAHPVGMKAPNRLGLYDMTGNVWEFCWGSHNANTNAGTNFTYESSQTDPEGPGGLTWGTYHLVRGGSWSSSTGDNNILLQQCKQSGNNIGFRVVRKAAGTSYTE